QAAHLARIGVDSITTNDVVTVRRALQEGTVDERARQAAVAFELAQHAAEATAAARRDGVRTVETKSGPADHVTEVDRDIEHWVRAVLTAQFPDHDVVGEEFGGTGSGERPCWYLDPIDGTANLANGFPWTSFSLADGGAGPAPVLAVAGRGVTRAGQPVSAPPSTGPDPLAGAMAVTELDGARAWQGLHELLDALGRRHCTLRIPGSGTASLAG